MPYCLPPPVQPVYLDTKSALGVDSPVHGIDRLSHRARKQRKKRFDWDERQADQLTLLGERLQEHPSEEFDHVQQMGIFQRYDTPMRRAVWMLWCTVNDPGNHKHTSEFRKPVVLAGGTHWYVTTHFGIKRNNAAEPRKELGGYYYYYCKDGGHVLCWLLFGRHKHITENFVA